MYVPFSVMLTRDVCFSGLSDLLGDWGLIFGISALISLPLEATGAGLLGVNASVTASCVGIMAMSRSFPFDATGK